MKTKSFANRDYRRNRGAFTFIEVMIATVITLIMFITFYTTMASGVATIQVARENLRATQIMVSRMEGIRLYRWDQLTDTNLLPTTFTENFYPNGMSGTNTNPGITYTGAVSVASVTLTSPASSYASNMYQITVQLNWQSTGGPHTRQMSTYYSKYGVQNYVWSN